MERSKTMTEGSEWKLILLFTLPLMAGNLLQQLYNTVDGIIVGNLVGETALAAVGTCAPLTMLFTAIALGMSNGAAVVLSQFYGAGRMDEMKKTAASSLILLFSMGVALSVVGCALAGWLLRTILGVQDYLRADAEVYFRIYALGLLAQLVLFPAINRRAVKVDWSDTLKAGDPANLPATMQVFTALRIPRANFSGVYAESSGFGTEKLTFLFWDKDGSFSVSGRVTLGILHGLEGDVARLQAAGYRLIGDFSEYTAHLSEEELQARQRETLALRRETLAALPSGVKVYASIHFAEDLTFETLAQLLADWQDADLTFENIHVNTYLSGGDLFLTVSPGGANLTDYNDAYPMLDLYQQPLTAENLRQSLESRLQYMADHQKIVDWIDPDAAAYQTKSYSYLLKGLQDVGMTFDGAYVTASPAALLRLIDSGLVEGVGLKDADFDLS